jgi:hypothetical protein
VSDTGAGGKPGEVRYVGPVRRRQRAAGRLRHVGDEDAVRSRDGLPSASAGSRGLTLEDRGKRRAGILG